MYGQDRKELREVFFRAWQRHREQQPLVGIERIIASVALRHPEYHGVLHVLCASALAALGLTLL